MVLLVAYKCLRLSVYGCTALCPQAQVRYALLLPTQTNLDLLSTTRHSRAAPHLLRGMLCDSLIVQH